MLIGARFGPRALSLTHMSLIPNLSLFGVQVSRNCISAVRCSDDRHLEREMFSTDVTHSSFCQPCLVKLHASFSFTTLASCS